MTRSRSPSEQDADANRKRWCNSSLGLQHLDGLTLVEKMQVLISEGYGWEDVSVILDVRRQYVRQFMFGRRT